jgi:hypothetical protein
VHLAHVRPVVHDPAVDELDDAIAAPRKPRVVRDDQERRLLHFVHLAQQVEHRVGRLRVEIAARLVGQHERRRHREGARNRDSLLLTPRQVVRLVMRTIGEAHLREEPAGRFAHRSIGASVRRHHRHHDVLERGELGQQIVVLEDEADRAAAQLRPLRFVEPRRGCTGDPHFARRRSIEQAHHVQERALARSRRADQRRELATIERQVDSVQHLELGWRAEGIGLVHAVEAKDRRLVHR